MDAKGKTLLGQVNKY